MVLKNWKKTAKTAKYRVNHKIFFFFYYGYNIYVLGKIKD